MTKEEFVKLLDAYKSICDAVGYDGGQLYGLRDKADHASNLDDRDAYESAIERMNATIDRNQKIRDEIRTKLINLFKGEEN